MNTPIEPSQNEQKPPLEQATVSADTKKPETLDAGNATGIAPQGQKPGNVYTKGLLVCGNCGTELLGETCYQCGQPTKGLVRQFSSIMGDFLDTVLNIDSRVFRTIGPLIFRPGYLTQEYFSGRRIRFVSPVRLFFFLAVLTFLLAQFSLPEHIGSDDDNGDGVIQIDSNKNGGLAKAKTLAEVEKIRTKALAELDLAKKEVGNIPMAAAGLEQARAQINKQAEKRIAELTTAPAKTKAPAGPNPAAIPAASETSGKNQDTEEDGHISFNGEVWDPVKNPIALSWLPDSINHWLNTLAQRAENNGKRVSKEPKVIIEAVLSSLPMTLFLMLPVFALLLKIMFIFKRRLYMEHLIVALHSHAFLMLAIMILILFGNLPAWLGATSWLTIPINILNALLWIWMPIYLFLMQKRVYQQGWIITFIKYAIIGNLHIMLLSVAIGFTLIIKMIWL